MAAEDKVKLEQYIQSIPEAVTAVESTPPWPSIVPAAPVAAVSAAAPPPPAGTQSPAVHQLPGGLSNSERSELLAVQRANEEFQALRRFEKNDLLVLLDSNGDLVLGQATEDVDLNDDGSFKLQWWVNVPEPGLSVEAQRLCAEAPPDFCGQFQKMPRQWTEEQATDDVTVFWAGDKSRLLKNDGGVKLGKKRILSRIRTFPLRFVANEWASKNTKAQ